VNECEEFKKDEERSNLELEKANCSKINFRIFYSTVE
jgi:hypothetical protein